MNPRLACAFILVGLALTGCTYMSSEVDYEPGTDFAAYQTFAIERARPVQGDAPHVASLANAAWVDERTRARIRERLEHKGMIEAGAAVADLIFRYYYVASEEIRTSDRPGHVRWLRVDIREIHYDSYTRGTLVVDVVDRAQGSWSGTEPSRVSQRHPTSREASSTATSSAQSTCCSGTSTRRAGPQAERPAVAGAAVVGAWFAIAQGSRRRGKGTRAGARAAYSA